MTDNLGKNTRKYWKYLFDHDALSKKTKNRNISDYAFNVSGAIRGNVRKPSIILHGIMKRSGTVFVGELLHQHPEIAYYPNSIWEFPFLSQAKQIDKVQEGFFSEFENNREKIGDHDFYPLFGAAFLSYLFGFIPENQRMLLKMPGVQYLHDFYNLFPNENLLLLVRDGRDVVASTVKTWPQIRFVDACRRWKHSSEVVKEFHHNHDGRSGYHLARFEDAVNDTEKFLRCVFSKFGLDPDVYPYARLSNIPVIGSSTTIKEDGSWSWTNKSKDFKPVGRWGSWSSWRKAQFKRIAGKVLMDLGYCQDLNW